MKKFLSSVSKFAVVLCLSSNFAHAMEKEDELPTGMISKASQKEHKIVWEFPVEIDSSILYITLQEDPWSLPNLLRVCKSWHALLKGATLDSLPVPQNDLVPLNFSPYVYRTKMRILQDWRHANTISLSSKSGDEITDDILRNYTNLNLSSI